MSSIIRIKRTSVSGRAANSTTLTNPGELALNMTDGIMYSTNGSVIFEIGANNTNVRVSNTLTVRAISANGSNGSPGQVLTSNGTSTYWSTVTGGGSQVPTGGGTDKIFIENDKIVTTNYTINSDKNAGTFGPVTINSGITVTIPTGSRWVIV